MSGHRGAGKKVRSLPDDMKLMTRTYMNLAKDEHLVRLHIGLEDPSDLVADLKQALKHLK